MRDREPWFAILRVRIIPDRWARSWGYVSWSPVVVNFGVVHYNRWWFGNLQATFAWVYRAVNGDWPTYDDWDRERRGLSSRNANSQASSDR